MGDIMTYQLECRVCFQVPKPDELIDFGVCLEEGHVTCGPCYANYKEDVGNDYFCSHCRKAPVLQSANYLVIKEALREMADDHTYNCNNCNHEFVGRELSDHESKCSAGKYLCPICEKYVFPYDVMALQHPCMPTRSCFSKEKQAWTKVLYFEDLFKKDSGIFMIHGGYEAALCLSHTLGPRGLEFNIYWLDKGSIPAPDLLKLRLRFSLHTEAGTLFKQAKKIVHDFAPEQVGQGDVPEPQLTVSLETYSRWDRYTSIFRCKKCSLRKGHGHLIVEFA